MSSKNPFLSNDSSDQSSVVDVEPTETTNVSEDWCVHGHGHIF